MSAPFFFDSAAVFWPHTRCHPTSDGEGFVFCQTTDIGQGGVRDPGMRYYIPEKQIRCHTKRQLLDLQHAVAWALAYCRGDVAAQTIAEEHRTQ